LENEWHDYEQRKERWEDVLAKLEKPLAVYQSQKSGTGSISRTELAAVSSGEPGLTPKRLMNARYLTALSLPTFLFVPCHVAWQKLMFFSIGKSST
jgi:ABC-type phosphate transport system substrate-binding protein